MNGIHTVVAGLSRPPTYPTERQRQLCGIVALLAVRSLTARQVSLEMGMTDAQSRVLLHKLRRMGVIQITHYAVAFKTSASPRGRPMQPVAVYRAVR